MSGDAIVSNNPINANPNNSVAPPGPVISFTKLDAGGSTSLAITASNGTQSVSSAVDASALSAALTDEIVSLLNGPVSTVLTGLIATVTHLPVALAADAAALVVSGADKLIIKEAPAIEHGIIAELQLLIAKIKAKL